MTVLVENKESKIFEIGQEIRFLENSLIEKKRGMFIELLSYIVKNGKEDASILSQLFNVASFLSEKGDLRAQYCMIDFYSGKYNSSVVTPNLIKALKYVDDILVEKDVYSFAVDVCEKFNDKKRAFQYAYSGIVSSRTDNKTKQDLCKYVIDAFILKQIDFPLPYLGSSVKIDKFIDCLRYYSDVFNLEQEHFDDFCLKISKRVS